MKHSVTTRALMKFGAASTFLLFFAFCYISHFAYEKITYREIFRLPSPDKKLDAVVIESQSGTIASKKVQLGIIPHKFVLIQDGKFTNNAPTCFVGQTVWSVQWETNTRLLVGTSDCDPIHYFASFMHHGFKDFFHPQRVNKKIAVKLLTFPTKKEVSFHQSKK